VKRRPSSGRFSGNAVADLGPPGSPTHNIRETSRLEVWFRLSMLPRIQRVAAASGRAKLGNDRQMVGSAPAELAHMASQRTREAAVAQHHAVERKQR
jgi:hypothetical protein